MRRRPAAPPPRRSTRPGVRVGSSGCTVRPLTTLSVSYDHVYSGTFVLATTIAPASRSRRTTVASRSTSVPDTGERSAQRREAFGVERVLDGDGKPEQDPAGPDVAPASARPACASAGLGVGADDRVEGFAPDSSRSSTCCGQLDRRDVSPAQALEPLARRRLEPWKAKVGHRRGCNEERVGSRPRWMRRRASDSRPGPPAVSSSYLIAFSWASQLRSLFTFAFVTRFGRTTTTVAGSFCLVASR